MKAIDIGITPISKKEMIYFDWYYFVEMDGMPGRYAWRITPNKMLMGSTRVNSDFIDDDLKPLHKLMTKTSWRRTLPSCSGHFLELDDIWNGYADLAERINSDENKMTLKSARTNKEYNWNEVDPMNMPPSLQQVDFDLVTDAKLGLYGWIAADSWDIINFNKLARLVKSYGYGKHVKFETVVCKNEVALLIMTNPVDATMKKNLWEAIYEIARELY